MTQSLYNFLYQGLSMKAAGITLGVLVLAGHLVALLRTEPSQAWLKRFPRATPIGIGLLIFGAIWAWVLSRHMPMGEFYPIRRWVLMLIPAGAVATILYADDFLSVRATGILLLLVAAPVLDASFQNWATGWFLLKLLAYAWIVIGLFFVGMPYLMRDAILWVTQTAGRWKIACGAGAAYGAALLLCAVLWY